MPRYSALDWPVATCLHGVPTSVGGKRLQDADEQAWSEALRQVLAAGFTMVELADSHVRLGDLGQASRAALKSVFDDLGVSADSLHVQRQSVVQPGAGEENLAYAHRSIDAAAEWGMSIVSTGLHQPLTPRQREALWFWTESGATDPDDPEVWGLAVTRLRELGRHAADVGLLVSLEMYEDTYLGTADSAVRLVEEIGLDNVGLNPDVGNLVRLHRPIEDWREVYAKTLPYANYWHLKNYMRDEARADGLYSSMPSTLRDGIINYRQVIADAISVGYEGIFLMEQYGGDSLGVCAVNRDYVREVLEYPLSLLNRDGAERPVAEMNALT